MRPVSTRAALSAAPPAEKGTISRMGRCGQAPWARATVGTKAKPAAAASARGG